MTSAWCKVAGSSPAGRHDQQNSTPAVSHKESGCMVLATGGVGGESGIRPRFKFYF